MAGRAAKRFQPDERRPAGAADGAFGYEFGGGQSVLIGEAHQFSGQRAGDEGISEGVENLHVGGFPRDSFFRIHNWLPREAARPPPGHAAPYAPAGATGQGLGMSSERTDTSGRVGYTPYPPAGRGLGVKGSEVWGGDKL